VRQFIIYFSIIVVFVTIGWFGNTLYYQPKSENSKVPIVRPRPLEKYAIENLVKTEFKASEINFDKVIKETENYTSKEFFFNVDGKKVSGLINVPTGPGPFPVIVMYRGYVDQKQYYIGEGTQHAGEVFAQNGFITIAPDFLGYGDSDSESSDIFESRFQSYITAVTLLSSVKNIGEWDQKNIFIWGHSNGGQIALTTLEITGYSYPTVLWAPVSKPFPYSVLYYTDESDDRGKLIRSELAKFESDYDVEKYSLTNYLTNIKAPLELNQGTNDNAVPLSWSDLLSKNLKEASLDVDYIKYPGADHNMSPLWNSAVENSLNFYKKHLQ